MASKDKSSNSLATSSSASLNGAKNGHDVQRKASMGRIAAAAPIKTKSKDKMVVKPVIAQVNRITNFPISVIIEDRLAFSSFIAFCNESHTSENVFFWCAAVSFREIGNTDGWERGLPRTPSWVVQEQIDAKESQRRGTSLVQVKALRESLVVYDRFIAPEAPNWVCLPLEIVKRIEATLDSARLAKKGKMPTIPYTIFQEAERYAFLDMIHDILPRYLKQLAKDNDIKMMEYLKQKMKEKFGASAIKTSPAEQANEITKPETIANALSALYPSPRAVLNNRPGSGLVEPIDIKKFKEEEKGKERAATSSSRSSGRKGFLSIRGLFSRSSRDSEDKTKVEEQEKSRRTSTGSKENAEHVSKESLVEDLVRINSEASLTSQNDITSNQDHTKTKSQNELLSRDHA